MSLTSKQKQVLQVYDVHRLCDFLRVFPYRFDVIEASDERNLQVNSPVVLQGKVVSRISTKRFSANKSVSRFMFLTKNNEYNITIFNRPWLKTPEPHRICTVIGKLETNNRIVASNFLFKPIEEVTGIFPVYPLKKGITQKQIASIMKKVYALCSAANLDFFPSSLLTKKNYVPYMDAMAQIHFPDDHASLLQAISTMKYIEFFNYHLKVLLASSSLAVTFKQPKKFDPLLISQFINKLPYQLTTDQQTSVDEILADLQSKKVMMRLLQGDVGSGKTIVAIIAALATVASKHQVAFLAPTEILATQHMMNVKKILDDPTICIAFLSSSLPVKEKNEIIEKLRNHQIDVLIGTHAIFQQTIKFAKLGLVITDEQHRFGVLQRKALIEKGKAVDVLSMSATPIPRTLANALFSELDISTIASMPNERQQIITKVVHENSMRLFMDDLIEQINQQHQVYVICPAIDENQLSTRNVVSVYENLLKVYGKQFSIAMLHGQMDANKKEATMRDFVSGKIDMLISTTVIEVGIDVANANRLVIYDADRFGLSQLHQLRGRIGRSSLESICYMLTSSQDDLVLKRLSILENNSSGFDIAYHDLLNRGPGEIVGVRQSGLPSFHFGNVMDDQQLLLQAKEDVKKLIEQPSSNEEQAYLEKIKKENIEQFPTID